METVCIKVEKEFVRRIEKMMKVHHYVTKTEFIRDALREKLRQFAMEDLSGKEGSDNHSH